MPKNSHNERAAAPVTPHCTYPHCTCPTEGDPCGARVAQQDANLAQISTERFFLDLFERIAAENKMVHRLELETVDGHKAAFSIELISVKTPDGEELLATG